METSNEYNAVNVLSWIFDELDTQKFGIKNNKHFNYFDDSEENIQKINKFYLSVKPFGDIILDDKPGNDGLGMEDGRQISSKSTKDNKGPPNQGEKGDLLELRRSRLNPTKANEKNDKKPNESNSDSKESEKIKTKNMSFEGFNANISLNPEENNRDIFCNNKELRKYKSDYQINLKSYRSNSSHSPKKLNRSLSASALIPPNAINITVKFTNFTREKPNNFFNSSNRSLFNSTILSEETGNIDNIDEKLIEKEILTEFPDSKIIKNQVVDEEIIDENYTETKDELMHDSKINNSIKNTDMILEKIMDNSDGSSTNKKNYFNNSIEKVNTEEKDPSISDSSTTITCNSTTSSNKNIIRMSLESVITCNNVRLSKNDLSFLEKSKDIKEKSAFILNEYGQSLFRLRYYLLQLKYLIDCNKDMEQMVFYKLAVSQYPDSTSIRTWLKRRITREPLVHGYCLPPFTVDDESLTKDMFNRPLKIKIFHSLSLDKKYQVVEPLNFEFNRKVMGTSEHKSLVTCNSNLKYCQMKQRSDIILRTIFIKHLFQQAPSVKRVIGNDRFQSLKDKALINLQPKLSKHYKMEKTFNNSMISIKLKTNKKKGIYLQHHSKKASYDFSNRNARNVNNNPLSPQPVDSINNLNGGKGLYGQGYNKRFEKSKSYQNVFSSNSPSKLRNCHTLLEPTHKYSYSQPLTHIIFNKQNNQYNIELLPATRNINKEKSFFSKYIFPNNAANANNYHAINKSNSNMMMNNMGNNNNNSNSVYNLNNNSNSNFNISSSNKNIRNNKSVVMSDMTLNVNKPGGMNMNMSISNGNISGGVPSYGYRKHSHISSISSIKEITNNSNCYNFTTVKNSVESVSKAKINARNHGSDLSLKNQAHGYDIGNSNRKLKDIQSEKSLKSFKDSDGENNQNNFNQSDIINNYSDQDSVYSLSSNYSYDKNDDYSNNENELKNNVNEVVDSNKTIVVYKHSNKKENIFKKIFVIMKSKKQSDKSKSSNNKQKNKNGKLTPKDNIGSTNIVDSDETINNSTELSRSNPNTSISNSDFTINSKYNSNNSINNSYDSNETIHSNNNKPVHSSKLASIETEDIKKVKKSSKWHINIFSKKSKVKN